MTSNTVTTNTVTNETFVTNDETYETDDISSMTNSNKTTTNNSATTTTTTTVTKKCPSSCCERSFFRLQTDDATGHQLIRMGDGALFTSNIFLSTSIIVLARIDAGCDDIENDDDEYECDNKIYGFKPSSFITLISSVASALAVLFLPIIGAVLDYTPYRRSLGIASAVVMVTIQTVQIGTVEQTWFIMAMLQVVNIVTAHANGLCNLAYILNIATDLGEDTMSRYVPRIHMNSFISALVFLILIIGISILLQLDDVNIAQMSQGVSALIAGCFYTLGWYYCTNQDARHELPEGKKLSLIGFEQVFYTIKGMFKFYPRTVGLFFVSLVFSESAAVAFSGIAISYLNEVLKFGAVETGIVFVINLIAGIPGGYFSLYLAKKTSPLSSMKIMFLIFITVNFVSFSTLNSPDVGYLAYLYSILWGFLIGWYYNIKLFIFSHIVPKGQEAELTGFYIYFQQILVWFPPLLYTILNENGVPLSYAGMQLNAFLFCAMCCYFLIPPWEDCTKDAKAENKMLSFHLDMREISTDVVRG